jgi:uncharacterized RDD family membrane protein YckC
MSSENSFVHRVGFGQSDLDELNIETPEQVDLRFPIAGIGSRFLAVAVDTLLLVLAYFLLALLIYVASSGRSGAEALDAESRNARNWWLAAVTLVNFLLVWGYFTLPEAFWNGQTPGKRLMKIRVIKDSGRAVTLFESMARNLLRVVDFFPGMYAVGVIAMLCNRSHKRLGDLVAGTMVIHERTEEQPLLTAHQSRTFTASLYGETPKLDRLKPMGPVATVPEPLLAADEVARLGSGDLHLIETFFARALDLSIERRAELAARVAATLCGRMGIALPAGTEPERLLETLAYRMRGQGRF